MTATTAGGHRIRILTRATRRPASAPGTNSATDPTSTRSGIVSLPHDRRRDVRHAVDGHDPPPHTHLGSSRKERLRDRTPFRRDESKNAAHRRLERVPAVELRLPRSRSVKKNSASSASRDDQAGPRPQFMHGDWQAASYHRNSKSCPVSNQSCTGNSSGISLDGSSIRSRSRRRANPRPASFKRSGFSPSPAPSSSCSSGPSRSGTGRSSAFATCSSSTR